MKFYPDKTVFRQQELTSFANVAVSLNPNIYVTIAVDVAYVVSQSGKTVSSGIYMMDNSITSGSLNEGTMHLSTVGNAGSLIGWNVVSIDPNVINLSLEITFIQICTGTVFGSPPIQQNGTGYSWLGQLMYQGKQTYAIQIKVTAGLNPVSYFINWQASASCA